MKWNVKAHRYLQQYVDTEGYIEKVYEKGCKCTCNNCGWTTGSQALEFAYCPMCGEKCEKE